MMSAKMSAMESTVILLVSFEGSVVKGLVSDTMTSSSVDRGADSLDQSENWESFDAAE